MKSSAATSPVIPRKATNVTFDARLLASAKLLEVNISQAAEAGLAQAVAARQAALWLEQNQGALESSNSHVEQHGLPLARFRTF